MKNNDKCSIKGCRNKSEVICCGVPYCDKHWDMYCDGKLKIKTKKKLDKLIGGMRK